MKSLTIAMVLFSLLDLYPVACRSVLKAQGVEECTIPTQYEGHIKVNVTLKTPTGVTPKAIGTGSVHVDATRGRTAVFETVHSQGQTTKVNVVMTEDEAGNSTNVYSYLPDLNQCQNNHVNTHILPGTLPQTSTIKVKEGSLRGVPVQIWVAEINEGPVRGYVEMYLAHDTCMPIRVYLRLMVNGMRLTGTEDFDDMEEGLKDESVFDVPEHCLKQGNVKQDNVNQETAKQDNEKQETVKQDNEKQESVKQETMKQETVKQENVKQDNGKQENERQGNMKQQYNDITKQENVTHKM